MVIEQSNDEYDDTDSWGQSDYIMCNTCKEIEDKIHCRLCDIDYCIKCSKFKYYFCKYICEPCSNGLNNISCKYVKDLEI